MLYTPSLIVLFPCFDRGSTQDVLSLLTTSPNGIVRPSGWDQGRHRWDPHYPTKDSVRNAMWDELCLWGVVSDRALLAPTAQPGGVRPRRGAWSGRQRTPRSSTHRDHSFCFFPFCFFPNFVFFCNLFTIITRLLHYYFHPTDQLLFTPLYRKST